MRQSELAVLDGTAPSRDICNCANPIGDAARAAEMGAPTDGTPRQPLERLATAEVARRCAEEIARYRRGGPSDGRFGFELFRRAVVWGDDDAWRAVYEQYETMVRRWLHCSPDDADDLVAVAFARFWRAVDAEKFARFGALASVLAYLKMCARSAELDHAHAARSHSGEQPWDDDAHGVSTSGDLAEDAAARADGANLWRVVRDSVDDGREREVLYLSYVAGLSPKQICAYRGARFRDVTEVYRLKRAALDRLRRAPALQAR